MSDQLQSPQLNSPAPKLKISAPKIFKRGASISGVFHRALVREFATTGIFVFAILLGIVVFTQLVRLLSQSVSGVLLVEGVLSLLGIGIVNALPIMLSVSLFLSILLTLSRSYRDSEMVVWFCAGVGLTRWISPVLSYAMPVVLLIALLSLVLSPWALTQEARIKQELDSRNDVSTAMPGTFRESKQADRIFFIDNADPGQGRVGNIFVQSVQHGKIWIIVANEGLQETMPNGDRFLVLLNGKRYDGIPGKQDFKIIEFERYAIRIEDAEARQRPVSRKSLPTLQLLEDRSIANLAEFERRLSMPISALILALLAIPLSFVNPRVGRSLNIIMAVIIYMIYNNLISVSNALEMQGKTNIGFFGAHLLMLVITALFFYKRLSVFSWRRLLRKN